MATAAPAVPDAVDAVRAFNRFYTRRIGVLGERLLDSPYSLSEMRVLYELAHREAPTASQLCADLGLDPGYLSRLLRRLERAALVARTAAADDRRRSLLRLTPRGRAAFAPLDARARDEIRSMLAAVAPAARAELVAAMRRIEHLLNGTGRPAAADEGAPCTLRAHRPGDMGWVVARHGALYAAEWGYNHEFEALVARIVADFLERADPTRERCWIAERGGEMVGSVFLVAKSPTVAKLRLLLVEPSARGLGLGRRLVDECIRFARAAGYRKITLWTQSELEAARRIYRQAGFVCVDRKKHRSFGKDGLVAETWDVKL
jgi:DNA-binding MarR family transcriptional regulator/N-acetylglutamate synthase-like GNAT family acetyltransferase